MKNLAFSWRAVFLGFVSFSLACLFFYSLMHVYEFIVFSREASTDLTFADGMLVLSWHALAFSHVAFFLSVGFGVYVAATNSGANRWLESSLTTAVILVALWVPAFVSAGTDHSFSISLSAAALVASVITHLGARKLSIRKGAA